jgi:phage terminase large subunit
MMLCLPAPPPPPDYSKLFQRYGGYVERVDELDRYGGFSIPDTGFYTIQFHGKMQGLFQPFRYKVLEGGRGGTKSWAVARALIIISLQKKLRIICTREYQNTVADSVHKLLVDQIKALGLEPWFRITAKHIYSSNGSEFVFMGLGDLGKTSNRAKIKSFEGCDICWVEEAEAVTKETWNVLLPTIRKAGSEIWVVYNPCNESDATYQMFHENEPPGALVIKINWRDNFWISKEMLELKDYNFATDPEAADHIWDGKLKQHAEATIFRKKYIPEDFVTPQFIMSYDQKGKLVETPIQFFHAVDWGFANDPLTMVRFYMTEEPAGKYGGDDCIAGTHLWIDAECWGIGVEINEMVAPHPGALLANGKPYFFEKIPTYRKWPVKADCARPELISYVRNKGINISPAEKWDGSVEDGIAHLRGFIKIHIHKTKCPRACDDFANYRFKVDNISGQVLPLIVDKSNHAPDAVRYGLDGYIKHGGELDVWRKLGAGR